MNIEAADSQRLEAPCKQSQVLEAASAQADLGGPRAVACPGADFVDDCDEGVVESRRDSAGRISALHVLDDAANHGAQIDTQARVHGILILNREAVPGVGRVGGVVSDSLKLRRRLPFKRDSLAQADEGCDSVKQPSA